jgi:hypothetical protein
MGEIDSDFFLEVYPGAAGTKLDSGTTCHSGGSYVNGKGVTVTLGSCQWCHYTYGYDASGDILDTLDPYGLDYLDAGRDASAIAVRDRGPVGERRGCAAFREHFADEYAELDRGGEVLTTSEQSLATFTVGQ